MREWIKPDWSAPTNVSAVTTTRPGGVSEGGYASFNLAAHVGDAPGAVYENRRRLRARLGLDREPTWLKQVHEIAVVDAAVPFDAPPVADASFTTEPGVACAVLTADCLPVVFAALDGSAVAAAHAGWRGLAKGVLEATVAALPVEPAGLVAWLGPAIGPSAFEVGPEVRDAFVGQDAAAETAFEPNANGRWQTDLYTLARLRLDALGVSAVSGGGFCTHTDKKRFYSYRRNAECGRMATIVVIT